MNDLFDSQSKAASGPVECLGQTFPSDEARREHFLGLLREKLRDPEFRKIEGFPIGTRRGHPGHVRPALLHRLPESLPRRIRPAPWQAL